VLKNRAHKFEIHYNMLTIYCFIRIDGHYFDLAIGIILFT